MNIKLPEKLKNLPTWVLAVGASTVVIGLVVGAFLIGKALKNNEKEPSPTPTVTQSTTPSVSETPVVSVTGTVSTTPTTSPTPAIAKVNKQVIVEELLSGATFKYSFSMPKDALLKTDPSDSSEYMSGFSVRYDTAEFNVAQRYEAYPTGYKSYIQLSGALGNYYRVVSSNENNTFYYVSKLQTTGTCQNLDDEILNAPCGDGAFEIDKFSFIASFSCVAPADKVWVCDDIMKSVSVAQDKVSREMTLTDPATNKKVTYYFVTPVSASVVAGSKNTTFYVNFTSGTKMTFIQESEGYKSEFSTQTDVLSGIVDLKRVTIKGGVANTYYYANNVITDITCPTTGGMLSPPCGLPLIYNPEDKTYTSVSCVAQPANVSECDTLMKILVFSAE